MPTSTPLDIEQPDRCLAYLREHGHLRLDETPAITPLAGGVSNRTVHVRRDTGESWVIKQALEKLRVQIDWFSSPQRIHREALGLRRLNELVPGRVPRFVFEDHEHHLLAMSAVPEPHHNFKAVLLAGEVFDDHVLQFARLLGTIHRRAAEQRDDLEPAFQDRQHFESLRLEPYYQYTAEQLPDARPFLDHVIEQTRSHTDTLVHGDYSPKNVLIHDNRLVLLDHEVIHLGDPAFDLGFAMTHLLSKAHHLPPYRQTFLDATCLFWNTYRHEQVDADQDELETRAVHHTLACLLARVAGRSPLEYLSPHQQDRQRNAALALMRQPPSTFAALTEQFARTL